ncbi:MAG: hypothetical protein DRP74_02770 [Candidatus Omnitrophota bacterium]|nr:MAG: hypothetical protein DRP74_02770 [Candidatus Omnitrophota bacterium]
MNSAKTSKKLKNKLLLFLIFFFISIPLAYAAPCYGTRMPGKQTFSAGAQTYIIFKRYLENDTGKIRSTQHFFLLSYGIFDWLSLDLKGGAGNIKQHPVGSDELDYTSSFAGGYGFRLKLYDKQNLEAVFGFQHISVHPRRAYIESIKHTGVLDDWQVSFLVSRVFKKINPYLGMRWSRLDYIHWIEEDRKRNMSDRAKDLGLVLGLDIALSPNSWLNLEGQFLDGDSLACSINFEF